VNLHMTWRYSYQSAFLNFVVKREAFQSHVYGIVKRYEVMGGKPETFGQKRVFFGEVCPKHCELFYFLRYVARLCGEIEQTQIDEDTRSPAYCCSYY